MKKEKNLKNLRKNRLKLLRDMKTSLQTLGQSIDLLIITEETDIENDKE